MTLMDDGDKGTHLWSTVDSPALVVQDRSGVGAVMANADPFTPAERLLLDFDTDIAPAPPGMALDGRAAAFCVLPDGRYVLPVRPHVYNDPARANEMRELAHKALTRLRDHGPELDSWQRREDGLLWLLVGELD